MVDRTISVRLKAEVTDFQRQIGKATTSLDQLVKKSGDSGGAAATTMGRLAQSARLQSDAWQSAGAGLVVGGAAITALNVAVAKTGIEYNTLQQKSRAALSTLLGGAEAANVQMDKLDDFARTSPFSKAVFIQAQQQMIGFGIETKKVVPYLSAINEAIAATGGSNNDLSEIVRIFSQIQAAGKITATDLMQFGQRGIDAATMIGSQMGKTGAQIRDDITSGSLDAGQALDALAAGMQDRFAGASAGVKETMEGAFDRVKAAWRDLSAGLMEGAVGPEGGGFLVDMTNQAADFLRWIDKFPDPVKNAGAAMGVLAGGGALAAGSFIMLVPQIVSTVTAVRTLSSTLPALTAAAGPAGLALLAVTGLAATIATDMASWSAKIDGYTSALRAAGDEGRKQERTLAAQGLAAAGAADAMERVGIEASLATDAALGDAKAREAIVDTYDRQILKLRDLADRQALEGVYNSQASADADRLIADRDAVVTAIDKELNARGKSAEQLEQESALMGPAAEAAGGLADATGVLAAQTAAAAEAQAAYLAEIAGADGAFIDIMGAYDALMQANRDAAQSTADSTKDQDDSWEDYIDDHGFKVDEYMQNLRDMVKAQEDWETNMILLAGKVSEDTLAELAKLGPEGAPLVAELVKMSGSELAEFDDLFANSAADATGAFADELDKAPAVWKALMQVAGKDAVTGAQAELDAGKTTLSDIISRYNLAFLIDADTSPADRAVNLLIARIRNRSATVDIYTRTMNRNGLNAEAATGGRIGDVARAYGLAGGGSPRRQPAGRVYGPGTPTSDSVVDVALSRDEFVVKAAASQHYGYDAMYALNSMAIPKDYFKPLGLAGGGSPSHAYYSPARLAGGGMAGAATGAPMLSDNDISRIADAVRYGASAGTREGITERDSMQAHAIGRRR